MYSTPDIVKLWTTSIYPTLFLSRDSSSSDATLPLLHRSICIIQLGVARTTVASERAILSLFLSDLYRLSGKYENALELLRQSAGYAGGKGKRKVRWYKERIGQLQTEMKNLQSVQ